MFSASIWRSSLMPLMKNHGNKLFSHAGKQTIRSLSSSEQAAIAAANAAAATSGDRPSDIGVLAAEFYVPNRYVSMGDMEEAVGVGKGKFEIGLGQTNMAFVDEREDICSMFLTATHNLLEKYNINPRDVGRLEVGTETMIDKSKAIKTVLMELFQPSGNFDIEGVDNINACYGGTAALFNSANWIESSSWDGRYAVVVCGDIAVYEKGPARPTCGAGIVAMLVGPKAPISFERGLRGSHFEHVHDFYKPVMSSEYPVVDGHGSIGCYLRALDGCYERYGARYAHAHGEPFQLNKADYALFHSPFTKMVRKSFSRLAYQDYLADPSIFGEQVPEELREMENERSYTDPKLTKLFDKLSAADYERMVEPTLYIPKQVGNTYTSSLYNGLLSLIGNKSDEELLNRRLLMFSYGSGMAATMWSMRVNGSLQNMRDTLNVQPRLEERIKCSPTEFEDALDKRENTYGLKEFEPTSPVDHMKQGTYYLAHIDDQYRRTYARV